ncbi:MAG: L,D-transpeptidase family protein [Actinomycetota bacterium]
MTPPMAHAQAASDPIAVVRDGRFFLRDQPGGGDADDDLRFGRADDLPLLGDWNGDGALTPGVRRSREFLLRNARSGGPADVTFIYGRADDQPIAGDWDGDGTDEIGVVRNGRFLLRTTLDGGPADLAFTYGRADDQPITGDWDGDGTDEIGVVRNGRFLLRTTLDGGPADLAFSYGRSGDLPLGGTDAARLPVPSDEADGGDDEAADDIAEPSPVTLQRGDEGPAVAALQRALRDSRYWVDGIDGVFGLNTEHAVLAVQKAHGLTRDGIYGPATRAALGTGSRPTPRSTSGNVVEFDEDRQLLLLVEDGVTRWTFHAAGGDESSYTYGGSTYYAATPNGTWSIYREVDGWRVSHLGRLYRPKYFHTAGIAVHGYASVPAYAASHGCVRVGMDQMDWLWANDEMPIGRTVWVYGSP